MKILKRTSHEDGDALHANALENHLGDVVAELNETIARLRILGFDPIISISQEGVAPGN